MKSNQRTTEVEMRDIGGELREKEENRKREQGSVSIIKHEADIGIENIGKTGKKSLQTKQAKVDEK